MYIAVLPRDTGHSCGQEAASYRSGRASGSGSGNQVAVARPIGFERAAGDTGRAVAHLQATLGTPGHSSSTTLERSVHRCPAPPGRRLSRWSIRRSAMRRFRVLASMVVVMLLGVLALHAQPVAIAQEASPAAGEMQPE